MTELSSIQTFEKIVGAEYRPTLDKFSNILKRIDLWNDDIKEQFDRFEWIVEENGFVYSSITQLDFFKTKLSDIPVRPLVMIYTSLTENSFRDNWMVCEFLMETEKLKDPVNGQFYNGTYDLIVKLSHELFRDFEQMGVYFTDEAQDGRDFDAIRCKDTSNLWQFDYALIPTHLVDMYSYQPETHKVIKFDDHIESWYLDKWTTEPDPTANRLIQDQRQNGDLKLKNEITGTDNIIG